MGRISAKLKKSQPNLVAEIKLRAFDQVKTDFGHFGENLNDCED
jgi:hypothetical protein